jgi:hypothetical protein
MCDANATIGHHLVAMQHTLAKMLLLLLLSHEL